MSALPGRKLGLCGVDTATPTVLSEPIVRMLFEHGAFTATDTAATARALAWLSLGLPAHVLFKSLAPAFFARENTITPLVSVLKGIALATAAAFLFGHLFGTEGIAASITLGAWSSALSLLREGAARFGFSLDAAARNRLPRIVLAALSMGVMCAPCQWPADLAPSSSIMCSTSPVLCLLPRTRTR